MDEVPRVEVLKGMDTTIVVVGNDAVGRGGSVESSIVGRNTIGAGSTPLVEVVVVALNS